MRYAPGYRPRYPLMLIYIADFTAGIPILLNGEKYAVPVVREDRGRLVSD